MTAALWYFAQLTRDQQVSTIQRMAAHGWTDHGIAAATRLAVEQIRRVLAEPRKDLSESAR